uniref:FLYWCH-type domain-containing protein n=1 Tax=Meloidogyne javanica TaxID=6303 RepID=A0A915N5B2_MELJA
MDNTDFVANMNNLVRDQEGIQQYQSTEYIKTIVCPNDEYSIIYEESEPTHSKTGKELFKHNGYTFVFDKLVKNRTLKAWGCELSHDCQARIRTDLNNNVLDEYLNVQHSHPHKQNKKHLIIEEIKCPPAIHSNNMINAYKINFNDVSNEFDCELLTDEQTIATNYIYVLDNYSLYVDQRIEQIFDENNAQTIPEGTMIIQRLYFLSSLLDLYILRGR